MYKIPIIIDLSVCSCCCKEKECIRCKYPGCDETSGKYFDIVENEFTHISGESYQFCYDKKMSLINSSHINTFSTFGDGVGGDPDIMIINNLTLEEIIDKIDNHFSDTVLFGFGNNLYLQGSVKTSNEWVKIYVDNLSQDKKINIALAYVWYCKTQADTILDNFCDHILNVRKSCPMKNDRVCESIFNMFELDENKDHVNFLKYKIKKFIRNFDYAQKFGIFPQQ